MLLFFSILNHLHYSLSTFESLEFIPIDISWNVIAIECNYYPLYFEPSNQTWITWKYRPACQHDKIDVINLCNEIFPFKPIINILQTANSIEIERMCNIYGDCEEKILQPFICLENEQNGFTLPIQNDCNFITLNEKDSHEYEYFFEKSKQECIKINMHAGSRIQVTKPSNKIGLFYGSEVVCCPQNTVLHYTQFEFKRIERDMNFLSNLFISMIPDDVDMDCMNSINRPSKLQDKLSRKEEFQLSKSTYFEDSCHLKDAIYSRKNKMAEFYEKIGEIQPNEAKILEKEFFLNVAIDVELVIRRLINDNYHLDDYKRQNVYKSDVNHLLKIKDLSSNLSLIVLQNLYMSKNKPDEKAFKNIVNEIKNNVDKQSYEEILIDYDPILKTENVNINIEMDNRRLNKTFYSNDRKKYVNNNINNDNNNNYNNDNNNNRYIVNNNNKHNNFNDDHNDDNNNKYNDNNNIPNYNNYNNNKYNNNKYNNNKYNNIDDDNNHNNYNNKKYKDNHDVHRYYNHNNNHIVNHNNNNNNNNSDNNNNEIIEKFLMKSKFYQYHYIEMAVLVLLAILLLVTMAQLIKERKFKYKKQNGQSLLLGSSERKYGSSSSDGSSVHSTQSFANNLLKFYVDSSKDKCLTT